MKSALRKSYLEKRKSLPANQVADKSRAVFDNWLALLATGKPQMVHTFLTIRAFHEVNTSLFIAHLQEYHPEVQIVAPRVGFESNELTHHLLLPHDLEVNSWGIPEPKSTAPRVEPGALDMVLVPMLAFDRQGHRIGYGGGYYDRFLAQLKPDCLRVGLCFDLGLSESPLPSKPYDITLNCVVTESVVHHFGTP